MSKTCPYCNSARSILLGNVFCSNHGKEMKQLESGTLFIKTKNLAETDWHISRLSIRCMLNGEQYYKTGSRESKVNPHNFLLVNQGQRYKTSFNGKHDSEMLMVGFKPGFAEGIYQSLVQKPEWMLENYAKEEKQQLAFFEKTYDADPVISAIFTYLHQLVNDPDVAYKKRLNLDACYTQLIERLLHLNFDIYKTVIANQPQKQSTKIELYRRLSIAKDFMDAYYTKNISLDEISKTAFLSVHHFKRLFQQYYKISPHRYILLLRLKRAQWLLQHSTIPVQDVCTSVGFENDSSFIRFFRQHTGITPNYYRQSVK